jgi:hypothetical protein
MTRVLANLRAQRANGIATEFGKLNSAMVSPAKVASSVASCRV